MADKIIEAKYEAMINALNQFAVKVGSLADEMDGKSVEAASVLSDEDVAAPQICRNIRESVKKYMYACKDAINIAKAMQEELDEARKEYEIWNED